MDPNRPLGYLVDSSMDGDWPPKFKEVSFYHTFQLGFIPSSWDLFWEPSHPDDFGMIFAEISYDFGQRVSLE